MTDLRSRADLRYLPTAALVAGLMVALAVATSLSYFGGVALDQAFKYQSAVVAAQRDTEVLQLRQGEPGMDADRLRPYEKLLTEDLAAIDEGAESEDERAPLVAFPATSDDYDALLAQLQDRAALGQNRFERSDERNVRTRDISNVLFALVALLFVFVQGRLRRRIDENRSLVERLQRAFASRRREVPRFAVGSVLMSATEGANVGGDTFDVFTFDGRHSMFLIADVSGKGVDAAVDTALIKYSIRALFKTEHDPGRVLSQFASIYATSAEFPEMFVVLFLGVVDVETGEVRYASAGHEPAFLRTGRRVEKLPPTGPIVGIDTELDYETGTLLLDDGDVIVLSTDGLTESRDAQGAELGADGVEAWLGEIDGTVQGIADAIVRRARRRSARISDDLAILVLRYVATAASAPQSLPREPHAAVSAPR